MFTCTLHGNHSNALVLYWNKQHEWEAEARQWFMTAVRYTKCSARTNYPAGQGAPYLSDGKTGDKGLCHGDEKEWPNTI